jgi:hypothetical protein
MNKPNLNIIIRGFLYREYWTPLSIRKIYVKNYTIDFLKCAEGYKKLISKLNDKYNITLYFTTYDTTPSEILDTIKQEFNPKDIFISEEKNSSQFTTSKTILSELLNNEALTLLIRSDIIITEKFINSIYEYDFNNDFLYVLCMEYGRNKVIDVVHIFPQTKKEAVLDYLSTPKLKHAHNIHKKIKTQTIVPASSNCQNTDYCHELFKIYCP